MTIAWLTHEPAFFGSDHTEVMITEDGQPVNRERKHNDLWRAAKAELADLRWRHAVEGFEPLRQEQGILLALQP